MLIAQNFPAFAQSFEFGCTFSSSQGLSSAGAIALASTTFFWCLCVVTLEVLVRIAFDAIALTLRKHQVNVWLISTPGAWPKLGTDRYPWYPTMRVFTPPGSKRWDAVMDEIASELTRIA